MNKSDVLRVYFRAIDSEPIAARFNELGVDKREVIANAQKFLESEIPGVPGLQFKDAHFSAYASDEDRRYLLQVILDKACAAVMGEPKDLIFVTEIIR